MTEYQFRLEQEIIKLKSQLEDANSVIRFYADERGMTEEEKQMSAEKYHLVYGLKANDYFDRWGHQCKIYSINDFKKGDK